MSKLKPVFIVSLPTVAVLVVVHSAVRLWQDGLSRGWAGAMVAGGVVALYFGNLYLYRTPRNGSHLTFPTGLIAIGAARGAYFAHQPATAEPYRVAFP